MAKKVRGRAAAASTEAGIDGDGNVIFDRFEEKKGSGKHAEVTLTGLERMAASYREKARELRNSLRIVGDQFHIAEIKGAVMACEISATVLSDEAAVLRRQK